MHIVCVCLNVKVEIDNFFDLEVLKLDLGLQPQEKCHPYFSKDIYKMPGNVSGISETHSRLIRSEVVGAWNICQCTICKVYTHATNYVTGLFTCSSSLKEEPADLKSYGRDRNISYSQVFQVCFPSHLDVPEDFLSHLPKCDIVDGDCIKKISKQANTFLEMAKTRMTQSSKSPVEKQIKSMEALERRVKCEERLLHMLILQNKSKITSESCTSHEAAHDLISRPPASDRLPPLCPTPEEDALEGSSVSRANPRDLSDPQMRIFNVSINTSDMEEELQRLELNRQSSLPSPFLPRSHDADGIFEMDDIAPTAFASSHPLQAALEPESDPDEDNDEEEDDDLSNPFPEKRLHRRYNLPSDVARSVPLDVPKWPSAIARQDRAIDAKMPKDPQEIAASMRELARSMRTSSVDVFGELPRRPQFPSHSEFHA